MAKFFDEAVRKTLLAVVPTWIHPNHFSIARGFLVIPVIFWQDRPAIAVTLFFIAVFLDLFDGPLARIRGVVSDNGALYDTLGDKAFVIGVLVFATQGCSWWIRGSVIALEIALMAMRPLKWRFGATTHANNWGKIKMWMQSIGIGCLLTRATSLQLPASIALSLGIGGACLSLAYHVRDIVLRLKDIRNSK